MQVQFVHFAIVFGCILLCGFHVEKCEGSSLKNGGKQTWSYVEVRPGANMFWWLYYTTATEDYLKRPLILWLQGGPGASSAGYGNFMEIGPLDANLQNRTFSWVNYANVLFVDNPVGSGFSYVNDTKLLCTNNSQITADLITLLSEFLQKVPEFQDVPLYIFSESYGGKMAAQFTMKLYKKILTKKIKCNLKGVSLGDSWISPEDSVLTWAPYLFSTSLVDNAGFAAINASAYNVKDAIAKQHYVEATDLFDKTEEIIGKCTNGVNVYNIMQFDDDAKYRYTSSLESKVDSPKYPSVSRILTSIFGPNSAEQQNNESEFSREEKLERKLLSKMKQVGNKWLRKYHGDPLTKLMNGQIKNMLRIIPKNVTWGGQSDEVFKALAGDFMKPVVNIVETLLNTTPLYVNVYSGQLDMIVDTIGTVKWVEKMKWAGIKDWMTSVRKPVTVANSTEMFVKSFKNFGFYWVLKSGHMVPMDAPETAAEMMQIITSLKKV
ncbi:Retinoid-inducible serine carboxypeptidase [Orchesella cincta]|uniref:Carboxypeptidase n=1 Tax=Orchesella cincta TaxID=48709 RepID=A0A1D2N5A7_ORCCI|nr:Retinoid-inducible serine carboxypeptidase [Orchesella cincta]